MTDEQLDAQEEQLRNEISRLPTQFKQKFYQLEKNALRDPDTYAVLNYFFVCGLHHFYLSKPLFGVMNLIAMLIGVLFWEFYGYVLIILVVIIELPQLFRSQRIVRQYNQNISQDILEQMKYEAQLFTEAQLAEEHHD